MNKVIWIVLTGLFVTVSLQAQQGFTIRDLHEWSRKSTTATTNTVKKDQLQTGERLNAGEKLFSSNGAYYLAMQNDGNLAIYDKNGRHQWDAGCGGNGDGSHLDMQADGNLVVYNRNGGATWSSRTHPYFDATFRNSSMRPVKVVLENDGVLALYNAANQAVWTSLQGTVVGAQSRNQLSTGERLNAGERLQSANGNYYAILQNDGNLAIYNKNGQHQWDARCGGNGDGSRLDMQADGNLVVYNRSGAATWSSRTHPYFDATFRNSSMRPVKVVLENDGVLVLYNTANQAVWTSKAGTAVGASSHNQLSTGERLNAGERLQSANGNYYAILQNDGNLVIYDKNGRHQWDARCGGNGDGSRLDMQADGNLVVYSRTGAATWSSKTHPYFDSKFRSASMKPVKLVIENDGRLKLYTAAKTVVWSNK